MQIYACLVIRIWGGYFWKYQSMLTCHTIPLVFEMLDLTFER